MLYRWDTAFERNANMSRRLERIENWPERARLADWCAARLAQHCGVTVRTLERHFLRVMHKTPHDWLMEVRMAEARALLAGGLSVKEAGGKLGFKNQHHFAREFKKRHGYCPSAHAARAKASS